MALRWNGGCIAASLIGLALGPAEAQETRSSATPPPPASRQASVMQVASSQSYQPPYAVPQPISAFDRYKAYLIQKARSAGVREATIQATVSGLELNSRVIQLDRAQPVVSNPGAISAFEPYRARHVTSDLISRGRTRYSEYWRQLQWIQSRYGVDPAVLMAIYGHETSYGSVTGSFDLLQALATLAYEGRRRAFFEDEFVAALKLIDLGVPRWRLKGSWAGATGYPQFMPSVALRLRTDGDGDGFADLWRSEPDGLASIANYLRDAGWKPNIPWGIAVRTPPSLNRAAIRSRVKPQRCERVYSRHSRWLTMGEWRSLGVVPLGRNLPNNEMATLLEPDGPYATAYLLTTNYRTILDYNCSNFYALSVGLLADAIARR